MLNYFQYLSKYLSVGPPVYFVVTDGYDYSDETAQNKICASHGCDADSMMVQLKWMADQSNKSYIALRPVSWLDTYFEFMHSSSCCYQHNNTHCPASRRDGKLIISYFYWLLDWCMQQKIKCLMNIYILYIKPRTNPGCNDPLAKTNFLNYPDQTPICLKN